METQNGNSSDSSSFEDLTKESEMKEEEKDDTFMDILGNKQLTKKVLVKGEPDSRPQRRFLCTINGKGSNADTGEVVEVFDNSVIQMGDNEVVQSLDMALGLMDEGEKAEITCTSRFAYGEIGLEAKNIPSGATIVYEIELTKVEEETDLEKKSYDARKEIGNKKRERGNFFFERQEFNTAINLYRRALEYLDETEGGISKPTVDGYVEPTNAQLQDLLEDRLKVYNNMAQVQLKIEAYEAALKSVEMVLTCQPNNVKALFRKAKILEAKADAAGAIPLLRKAATLEPDNRSIQNELSKLLLKEKREARNEKDLYQKMLGQAQALDTKNPQRQNVQRQATTETSTRLKLWGYTLGSVLISVAAIAIYRYKYSP